MDASTPLAITTSEGQSYALVFALAANDRAAFEKILQWTENNLAAGDLSSRLPAWQWGKRADGSWGIIDDNAASDADLWMAYALGEAGILWKAPRFAAMGELLAARILREETDLLPGLGRTLLPGPQGFHPEANQWKLNPSYVPLQVIRRLAMLYPRSDWKQLISASQDFIVRSAPLGFAPDWVLYDPQHGFQADPATKGTGSFNAIRVYLWAGMLDPHDPAQPALLKAFAPMANHVITHGLPPLEVNAFEGTGRGNSPLGFSAALLPFLASLHLPQALHQQELRVAAVSLERHQDVYYDHVLALFGQGWLENRFHFARNGALITHWTCKFAPSSSH